MCEKKKKKLWDLLFYSFFTLIYVLYIFRDTIFKERDEFATEIENAGKDLKLDKTVRSNTDIINQIASKQDNFGQQMSSQSQTLSVCIIFCLIDCFIDCIFLYFYCFVLIFFFL